MGTILYLTQPLFFFPLFQFLWLQRANTGFGLAEGAAEFLAGTIIVGGLAILVHSQPGRADRYWRGIMSSDMVPVFYERSRVKVKRFSGLLQKSWSLRKSRKSEAHRGNFLLHNQNVSGKQKMS